MLGSYLPLARALTGQQPQPFQGGGASGSWAPQPTFQERWNRTATKAMIEAAHDLFKRAGFEGISGQVDGPETLLFGEQRLPSTFDDKMVSILRKYRMLGMIGTAAGAEMAHKLLNAEANGQTL